MKPSLFKSLVHFNRVFSKKEFVFLVSSMRSGSTLLKSLLANAPDVSHLPEIHFHKYKKREIWKLKTLSPKRILLLKKPSWGKETNYPTLPLVDDYKIIVLIRNPYDTITSLYKAYDQLDPDFRKKWTWKKMLNEYWLPTYESIQSKGIIEKDNAFLVRYEELVETPIPVTQMLFQFIGSIQQEGVESYNPPRNYEWNWNVDDGGEKIKTRKVQPTNKLRDNQQLLDLIETSDRVKAVMTYFGY